MDQASLMPEVIEEAETTEVSVGDKVTRVWSPNKKLDIIKMFNDGYSMGVIGDKYSCSRGCISGIINRERKRGNKAVKGRQVQFVGRGPDKTKIRTNFGKPIKGLAINSFISKPPVKVPRVRLKMIESTTAVTFAELESHHCKYPLGNPRQSDFRFCGCTRLAGKPYCEAHTIVAGKMYGGPQPKTSPFRLPR